MKKIGIVAGGICLVFSLLNSQTLSLTSPNGGERLVIGSTHTITWSSSGITGNVKIGLFKGDTHLGNIVEHQNYQTGFTWHVGDPLLNGATYGVGSDYKIQVQSEVNWQWKDQSDQNFSIGFSMTQIQAVDIKMPPRIIRFAVNDGAETTAENSVTLNHRVMGGAPTHYRLQIRGHWRGWASYPYPEAPVWNWSPALGENTLVFQVKNEHGESNIVTDTIAYACYKEFTVNAATARLDYCPNSWKFDVVMSECANCDRIILFKNESIECSVGEIPIVIPRGHKAEFVMFGGREINEGWTFVSYELDLPTAEGTGYRMIRQPSPGSRDITLQFRLWHEIFPFHAALSIRSITLRGPCNGNIADAFR